MNFFLAVSSALSLVASPGASSGLGPGIQVGSRPNGAPLESGTGLSTPDVIWCDLTRDQLVRFTDRDGDISYLSPFEASSLWSDAGASPRAVRVVLVNGVATVTWVDTVRDAVFRGQDQDGDGRLRPEEVVEFRSSHALDGGSSPDGLEVTADGAVWWSSDGGSHVGLFRLRDLDGDGDANGVGEQEVLVDGSTLHLADVGGALVELDVSAIGRLTAAGNGVVAAVHGSDEALYRFEDLNDDGDTLDVGEARLFLNASGRNPNLPLNPDFASGVLPSLLVSGSGSSAVHARLAYLTSYLPAGAQESERVYVVATDASSTMPSAYNFAGQGLNGLLLRAVDGNGDGDVNDSGEVVVFHDGSVTAPAISFPVDGVLGLGAVGQTVLVADLASGAKRIHRLEDFDGDGTINPLAEFLPTVFSLSTWGDKAPFPTGHSFVVDLTAFPAGWLADPVLTVTGAGCSSFAIAPPTLGAVGQATMGTSELIVSVGGAAPGAETWLAAGTGEHNWFGAPLPYDLSPFGLPGCSLYVDPFESFGAVADANGEAAWALSVPYLFALEGFVLGLQGLVREPVSGAVALTALGETVVIAP